MAAFVGIEIADQILADIACRNSQTLGELEGDASGRTFEVPATWLPLESRPGDVLRVVAFGSGERRLVQFGRDEDERRRRLDSAREVLNRLKADDDGGDIEL